MLNFRQIEIFRAVMIAKTVNGAARMLNSSQPGLSRSLKYMEDRLGFALFTRAGGRLRPTQEAAALFVEISHVYKQIEDLDQIICRLATGQDRILRIGAPPSIGHAVVPLVLSDVQKKFPNINIQFDILAIEQVVDYLVIERGEYALTHYDVDHPNIESRRIGGSHMVCVVPQGHALASNGNVRLAELVNERLISFHHETPHSQVISSMFAAAGEPYQVATQVRFAETAVVFVQHGLGVAIVDEHSARRSMDSTRIVELDQTGVLPVFLNRNRLAPQSAASTVFEAIIERAFLRPPHSCSADRSGRCNPSSNPRCADHRTAEREWSV